MGHRPPFGQLSGMPTELDSTTDTSLLESLEFEIPCKTAEDCDHPASAYLTLSCGHGWFTCDPHAVYIQDGLEKLHAIAVLTHHHQCACIVCNAPDPLVASVVPIDAGGGPA